ncbi:MAG: sensor histidine kinase [Ekhidna sp.]
MQYQIEMMEIGSIAIFAAYNLVLFSQVRKKYYLYLGLLSFFMFLRATLVDDGSMIFYAFFPDFSLALGRKIEFFSSYAGAPLSVLFSYTLYPNLKTKKYITAFIAISCVFLLVVIFTSYSFFYNTLYAYQFVILGSYVLMFIVLIKAVMDKSVGAMFILSGTAMSFLFVMAELLKIAGVIYIDAGPNLVNTGFVIFLFLQSIGLSEIFASSFKENQELNKNLEKRVNEKTSEISRASLLRDTLIRIVSHDIRGPMSNLKSVITLVREDQVGIDQAKEFMGTIDKGVDHTIQMLDELMEWGHAASQNKRIQQEDIVLKEIIDPAVTQANPNIASKDLSFKLSGDTNAVCLFDKNALKVIIRNLLSNGVKFTEKGGSVEMKIEKRSTDILIKVIDSGIGIPDEMKSHLFEMKKDNKRPGTENEKSSGVGLFICNDLITQNDGTLSVMDNPTGKGTIFSFTLKQAS